MNNNSQILKTFNTHFVEFLEDIERVFPNDNDLLTCKNALIQMKKANPKLIIVTFKNYVTMYKKEILDGNLDFFINKDYKSDVEIDPESNKMILDKIEYLRTPVREMNTEEQGKVIKYMQNLTKLCELYN
tara:strand:+ start:88 stop:477 length:390 start_codon:yes stop_codon:yes gene_type:complete